MPTNCPAQANTRVMLHCERCRCLESLTWTPTCRWIGRPGR